jgi:hypothetical protein
MRPVFQPASHRELPMVAFSCGMTHTSGLVVHEMMTLFFVLSPSQIEVRFKPPIPSRGELVLTRCPHL